MGCMHAVKIAGDNRCLCPFCRTPPPTSNGELIERLKKRVNGGAANAIRLLGCYYRDGLKGEKQNLRKAMKLFLRAGELGNAAACCNLGVSYQTGKGVERDTKKAKYYFEHGAMGGDVIARYNLLAVLRRMQPTTWTER